MDKDPKKTQCASEMKQEAQYASKGTMYIVQCTMYSKAQKASYFRRKLVKRNLLLKRCNLHRRRGKRRVIGRWGKELMKLRIEGALWHSSVKAGV